MYWLGQEWSELGKRLVTDNYVVSNIQRMLLQSEASAAVTAAQQC